jgi:hypothetical protein
MDIKLNPMYRSVCPAVLPLTVAVEGIGNNRRHSVHCYAMMPLQRRMGGLYPHYKLKVFEKKKYCLGLRDYPDIHLERIKITTKYLSSGSQYRDRDCNRASPNFNLCMYRFNQLGSRHWESVTGQSLAGRVVQQGMELGARGCRKANRLCTLRWRYHVDSWEIKGRVVLVPKQKELGKYCD